MTAEASNSIKIIPHCLCSRLALCSLLLPAGELRGEFAEEVGGGAAACVGQGAGVMGEGRGGGWGMGGCPALSELTPVEGAADGGASGQAGTLSRRGAGHPRPGDAVGGGGGRR